MEKRVYNFSAGPAVLPLPVLEAAQRDLLCYPGAGASVMEISHRSKAFAAILDKAKGNIRALLGVPNGYSVLFLQGGATLQFSMIAMNFLQGSGHPADYINTGSWANKAIKEAQKHGEVNVCWSGKGGNFTRVPKLGELKLSTAPAYVHFTANETIQGIEFQVEPETGGAPLICDASSDFLSRPVDISKYALMYAGAQKNVGPAGVAVVIIRNDLLERVPENLPSLLDYKLMAEQDSLYNTPPCFAIYVIALVTDWLLNDMGGLEGIAAHNRKKAQMLYDVIDAAPDYLRPHAQKDSRSLMNVTWRLPTEELEKEFIAQAEKNGLCGLKGHRSVGGVRASIYNAMPIEGVEALCSFMTHFRS